VAGRPSKRTPECEARLLSALSAGNTRSAACHFASITAETLSVWLERFPEFSEAVKKAEADAEVRHVANIAKAAQEGQWQASAWWLERRRPEAYARRYDADSIAAAAAVQVTIAFDHAYSEQSTTLSLPDAD